MDGSADLFLARGGATLEAYRNGEPPTDEHGYGRLVFAADGSALDFEAVAYVDGAVMDRVRLEQDTAAVAARQAARASPRPRPTRTSLGGACCP